MCVMRAEKNKKSVPTGAVPATWPVRARDCHLIMSEGKGKPGKTAASGANSGSTRTSVSKSASKKPKDEAKAPRGATGGPKPPSATKPSSAPKPAAKGADVAREAAPPADTRTEKTSKRKKKKKKRKASAQKPAESAAAPAKTEAAPAPRKAPPAQREATASDERMPGVVRKGSQLLEQRHNPFSLDDDDEEDDDGPASAAAGQPESPSTVDLATPKETPAGDGKSKDTGGDRSAERQDTKAGSQTEDGGDAKAPAAKVRGPQPPTFKKPTPREPAVTKIRRQMTQLSAKVQALHRGIQSDQTKESSYWSGQQSAFNSLLARVQMGKTTLQNFQTLLRKQQKAETYAVKYQNVSGWRDLGAGEGAGMRKLCQTKQQLLEGLVKQFESLQDQLFSKPAAEAARQVKELETFGYNIQRSVAKMIGAIRKQRDLTDQRWEAYNSAVNRRHKLFSETEKAMRPSDDPYLVFEQYRREVTNLHKQQASYNSIMGQLLAEFETRECTRTRNLRSLMIGTLATKKQFFERAALMCDRAMKEVGAVDTESDLLRFRQEGGLLFNPKTRDVRFECKSIGLDFKDNVICNVHAGSQAFKNGVQVGWRIVKINGKTAPASHDRISALLQSLKRAGKPIIISFCEESKAGLVFDQPPPRRSTSHIDVLANSELATVGHLSRMSKTMGFTSWTKMYCVITCSGVLHVLNSKESLSPYSSIQLHSSALRLAPQVDKFAFEIEESTQGFFGTKLKTHTFRTMSENAMVDWVMELRKYLRDGKTGIKMDK